MTYNIFHIFLIIAWILECEAGGEHCIGKDGHLYYCNGFCCAGFGCCSYTSLWYAWTLMALVLAACLCGCVSCSMRKYRLGHQAAKQRSTRRSRRGRYDNRYTETDRLIGSRQPKMTYNACSSPAEYGHINNTQPPPYNVGNCNAPPPPYSTGPLQQPV